MRFLRSRLFVLTVFAAVIAFAGLNIRELASGDETRVAGIIAGMTLSGDMVTPKLNGHAFLEYPPLYYQCGALFFRLFGFTDAAAKLPSAICAFGAALLVFAFARRIKLSDEAALAAGVMFLTGAQVFGNGRKCMVDMMLAFFVLLAIYSFHSLVDAKSLRAKAGFFLLYSAGLAGGFMTKGAIGFAFPLAGLGVWLVADDVFFAKRFTFVRYLLLGLGILTALFPILWWLRLLYLAGGEEYLRIVLIVNCFGRFSGTQGDHVKSWWFYLTRLPESFQPWLIFFLAALVHAAYLLKKKKLGREILLLVCESVVPFVMLSCAAAKRQVYLLPIFSAWAVLGSWFMIDCRELWLAPLKRFVPWIIRYWHIATAAFAAVALIVFSVIAPGWSKLIPIASLIMLAAALLRTPARAVLGLLAFAFFFVSFDAVAARWNRRESLRELFEECERLEREGYRITLAAPAGERIKGAAVFYMKKQLPEVDANIPLEPNEKRIIRGKDSIPGRGFADRHHLRGAADAR